MNIRRLGVHPCPLFFPSPKIKWPELDSPILDLLASQLDEMYWVGYSTDWLNARDLENRDMRGHSHEQGKDVEWVPRSRQQFQRTTIDAELEREFRNLVEQWCHDNLVTSSITQLVMHPAYLRIIGMGRDVIPLLLRELQQNPNHWFYALNAITGENPVKPEDVGNIRKMSEAWLQWGKDKGHL